MSKSRALTSGQRLLKIAIFYEKRLFSVAMFLYPTSSMLCHAGLPLERSANAEKYSSNTEKYGI